MTQETITHLPSGTLEAQVIRSIEAKVKKLICDHIDAHSEVMGEIGVRFNEGCTVLTLDPEDGERVEYRWTWEQLSYDGSWNITEECEKLP